MSNHAERRSLPRIFPLDRASPTGPYLRAPPGIRHGIGLYVLTLTADRIGGMTRFDTSVLPWFGPPTAQAATYI